MQPSNKTILNQIQFHDTLNTKLWKDGLLQPEVRLKLFEAAMAFYHFIDIDKLLIQDILFTGSNAAFNYTAKSDIDIHLLVDFQRSTCPDLASNFFTTKKALWGKTYDATIRDYPIELYVEDAAEPVEANGVYSVLHDRWLRTPVRKAPQPDDKAIVQKTKTLVSEIDGLLDSLPSVDAINDMLERLYVLRQNGLMDCGEFSTENLTFKSLRSLGYIDKLRDARVKIRDKELTL